MEMLKYLFDHYKLNTCNEISHYTPQICTIIMGQLQKLEKNFDDQVNGKRCPHGDYEILRNFYTI